MHFIGIDIGDNTNFICVLNKRGDIVNEVEVSNTKDAMKKFIRPFKKYKLALEACSHSLWLQMLLSDDKEREVFVSNPRKVRAISDNIKKSDPEDARLLARLVRSDTELLSPIQLRDIGTQQDLMHIKSREMLIRTKGDLVRHVRGVLKPFGLKLPKEVTSDNFHKEAKNHIPKEYLRILNPLLNSIKNLVLDIAKYDKKIKSLIKIKYPETNNLQTMNGVGPLTALTFILVIGDPTRFKKSRDVGAYLGLTPRRDQSGDQDKSLPITKAGDVRLRCLLVNCSHHILGVFGKESQIRSWGLKIAGESGNKIRKKKAVIAVSRKLAVIMHSMLISGKPFENTVVKS